MNVKREDDCELKCEKTNTSLKREGSVQLGGTSVGRRWSQRYLWTSSRRTTVSGRQKVF